MRGSEIRGGNEKRSGRLGEVLEQACVVTITGGAGEGEKGTVLTGCVARHSEGTLAKGTAALVIITQTFLDWQH